MAKATVSERPNNERISCWSRRPRACAVSPLVPIRRNPNTQYTRLNTIDPTAMAPMYVASTVVDCTEDEIYIVRQGKGVLD